MGEPKFENALHAQGRGVEKHIGGSKVSFVKSMLSSTSQRTGS